MKRSVRPATVLTEIQTDDVQAIKHCNNDEKVLSKSRRDLSRWPRGTFYPQKLELTSPTSGGRSVGKVRSRTQATEFSLVLFLVGNGWIVLRWILEYAWG
jgi:hypothetical protein